MLAEKLKLLRKEKGMTQEEFAKALNVTKGAVAMWETDKRTPDLSMLKDIADFFNVSVDWLIGTSKFRNNYAVGEFYSGWNNYPIDFEPPFDFCPLLKKMRIEQGISCDKMATAIGATAEQYTECEDGILPINFDQAEKLSNVLGTNASQILFDNGFYSAQVPKTYHNNVREWEMLKKNMEDEAMKEISTYNTDIKIVARHLEEIPSNKRKELIDTISQTIDMYKKAIGFSKKEDK